MCSQNSGPFSEFSEKIKNVNFLHGNIKFFTRVGLISTKNNLFWILNAFLVVLVAELPFQEMCLWWTSATEMHAGLNMRHFVPHLKIKINKSQNFPLCDPLHVNWMYANKNIYTVMLWSRYLDLKWKFWKNVSQVSHTICCKKTIFINLWCEQKKLIFNQRERP